MQPPSTTIGAPADAALQLRQAIVPGRDAARYDLAGDAQPFERAPQSPRVHLQAPRQRARPPCDRIRGQESQDVILEW